MKFSKLNYILLPTQHYVITGDYLSDYFTIHIRNHVDKNYCFHEIFG